MKKIKKALIGITSLVMAFSMTAICACTTGDNTGSTGGTGNTGNTGNEGGNQGGATVNKSDAKKVLDAFQKQSFKGISLDYSLDTKVKSVIYESDEDGKKSDGGQEMVSWIHSNNSADLKINPATFEFDAVNFKLAESLNDDGSAVDETAPAQSSYNYAFVRGGKMFGTTSNEEIKDLSKVTLEHDIYFELPEELQGVLAMIPEGGLTGDIIAPVATLIGLADEYNGATFADKKLTVNLNKVVYGLYSDVIAEVEKLNEDTTVGDLVAAKPVKALIQSLTYGIDATMVHEQIIATLTEMLTRDEGTEQEKEELAVVLDKIKKGIIAPEEGEDVYSYLVKNIESKDFAAMIIYVVTGEDLGSLISPFADMKFADIMTLISKVSGSGETTPDTTVNGGVSAQMEQAAPTIEDIKELAKQYIEKYVAVTEDKFTVTIACSTEISQAELVFAVNDSYEISSVSVSADYVMTYKYTDDGYDGVFLTEEEISNGKLEATVEFESEELTLADISGNVAVTYVNVFKDRIRYYQMGMVVFYSDGYPNYRVAAGIEIKDGEFAGINMYTVQYNSTLDKDEYNPIQGSVFNGKEVTFELNGVSFTYSVTIEMNDWGCIVISFDRDVNEENSEEYYDNLTDRVGVVIEPEQEEVLYRVSDIIEGKI